MYKTYNELKCLREQVIIDVDKPEFSGDTQIKVCSYDLRLGNIFWKSKRKGKIDLSFTKIYQLSPRRLWKKITLKKEGKITIKSGEMLLGRTHEKIAIPPELVGKITVRSSYARLGLWTACNCDLVNPGYEGHIPLELINTSKHDLTLKPYLPICQLFLMKLDGEIDSCYQSEIFQSNYIDDDGGPSKWWRDLLNKKIESDGCLNSYALDEIKLEIKDLDDDILNRFEDFIDKRKFDNSQDLLEQFSKSEKKAKRRNRILYLICGAVEVVLLGLIANSLFAKSILSFLIFLVIFLVILIPIIMYFDTIKDNNFYERK
ncbi:hypothetical protein AVI51_14995 [Piscirickettsia salmonis]|uniref:Deoxycytidine triphosphate deaminase n=1 Tax=Piscirickettsia salmonis TaxID=1238 RepID=A0A9Q6LTQ5_PISSA|nr:dCTP deaminase [Piscirickettsia salmonis]ALA24337.1 deoxycytidine triphosphate deaminase [Piscirickettsia salmonis]APS44710.1 hypothetical protein AVI48_10280 [Piscirickettsia salmonis]APS48070.1 hypothetical protein AVI49_10885 [Piscirickettsia salmonis]APS52026.1 hypothetical protein AVI50_15150 [Piscirickettsia salmonis]APS55244.1 hypothetical protein AVI51_14995 [Piscirickettsia salmonis]